MSSYGEWCIPSNSGRRLVHFSLVVFHEETDVLEFDLTLSGQGLRGIRADADQSANEHGNNQIETVDRFKVLLPSLLIPRTACEELLGGFTAWLDLHSPFDRTLRSTEGASIVIQVDRREELITTDDHPVLTLYYEMSGCRCETFFVVDESCIRIARDGLASVLGMVRRSKRERS